MQEQRVADGSSFLLSDLIGRKVRAGGRRIGRLGDLVAVEIGRLPEITHLLVNRSFGYRSLLVPWANVLSLDAGGAVEIACDSPERFEGEPAEGQICLADHVLDKKVLDCDDDEVEVVYDIRLTARNGLLYATEVDCSRAGFLRRIGLKKVSDFIRGLAASMSSDTIPWTYVQRLPATLGSFAGNVKLNVLKTKLPEIHPVDLADILEELDHEQRLEIFSALDTEQASDTLEEMEPRVQRQLVSSLSVERTAELVEAMTPAQGADLLAAVAAKDADLILARLPPDQAARISFLLEHHDDQISAYITPRIITYRPEAAVRDVMRTYRHLARRADVINYVYVTDAENKALGVIDIRELLQAGLLDRLGAIMTTNMVTLRESDSVAEARRLFARYGFRAIPVVDGSDVLKGVVPYRDLMQLQHPTNQ
jgi:CBS domain-containing protein